MIIYYLLHEDGCVNNDTFATIIENINRFLDDKNLGTIIPKKSGDINIRGNRANTEIYLHSCISIFQEMFNEYLRLSESHIEIDNSGGKKQTKKRSKRKSKRNKIKLI